MADSSFNLHSLLPQRGPLEGFQKAASDPAAFSAAFIWGIIFFGAAVFLWVASRNRWQVREVARQMNAGLFERSVFNPPKLSTALRELHPQAAEFFKDVYTLEFLGLPEDHSEADLHGALLRNLGHFLTELGRDFCFIGSQHPLQVGGQDFALDLLFFHRGLNCLLAIELKAVSLSRFGGHGLGTGMGS